MTSEELRMKPHFETQKRKPRSACVERPCLAGCPPLWLPARPAQREFISLRARLPLPFPGQEKQLLQLYLKIFFP